MSVIKVESFGGIMPSVSARALMGSAAQSNTSLFLATNEFRPLAVDKIIETGLANAKTLYRLDSESPWITSTSELSYARGQNNADTTKRTYYSNNTTDTRLRQFDKNGNDTLLGVPAPTAITVTTTQGVVFTSDSLVTAIRSAIAGSVQVIEPDIRYSEDTILAGPFTNPGLFFATDTTELPSQVTDLAQTANLYAKVAMSRITALQVNLADVAVTYFDDEYAYIPIVSLPFSYIENGTPLATSLAAIVNTRTNEQVLSTEQIEALREEIYAVFDTESNAYSLRTELTQYVTEFYELLFNYPDSSVVNPDPGGPTDPTGPGPVVPTTPIYIIESGVEFMAPEWEIYYNDLSVYAANQLLYNSQSSTASQSNKSVTDRVREVQSLALEATKAIEAVQLNLWNELTKSDRWVSQRVNQLIAQDALPAVDPQRVIQTRFYLTTLVNSRGEESAPSPPSEMQTVDQYSTTVITRPTIPEGREITAWRLYRSNTSADLTLFQFVTTVDYNPATPSGDSEYTDSISNEELREVIPTVGWDEPITGLKGLISMPNGIMAAFKDNTIHFCEPFAPYAFPPSYQISTEFPIVGLGVFGQTLFVGTTGNPYLISGADSASMSSIKLESNQSCVSRRSISSVQGGVIYASPDGLCFVNNSGVQVITRSMFTREDWQKLVPSSMVGATHEDIYYFFYDTGTVRGCYALDIANLKLGVVPGLTEIPALYVDRESDKFFANYDALIIEVFAGEGRRTGVWKTPLITMPQQTIMAWLKVYGEQTNAAPITVNWYADGALRHTAQITSIEPVRLPPGRWLEHEVEIIGTVRVTKVALVSSTEELKQL
jgi:hypothetical protein